MHIWFVNKKFIIEILNKPYLIICFTVWWFQAFLSNMNNPIYIFFYRQLNSFKICCVTQTIQHQSFICTIKWIYTWFLTEYFVGNFIFKWVRVNFLHTINYCYCLHTVKWLQVLQSNINNSIQYQSFVCTKRSG